MGLKEKVCRFGDFSFCVFVWHSTYWLWLDALVFEKSVGGVLLSMFVTPYTINFRGMAIGETHTHVHVCEEEDEMWEACLE